MSKVNDAKDVISLINSQFNQSLPEFINQRNWKENTELIEDILTGNVDNEQKKYLESNLSGLTHKRDNRSVVDYGRELLVNWLLEDIIINILENDSEIAVNRSGEDANREFLETTTSDPDLEVSIDGNNYLVEIIVDYTGYWKNYGNIDLRDNKYNHLKESSNSLLMGIDFTDKTVFIDKPIVLNCEFLKSHPVWNKPAYRGDTSTIKFTEFSNLNKELKNKADKL